MGKMVAIVHDLSSFCSLSLYNMQQIDMQKGTYSGTSIMQTPLELLGYFHPAVFHTRSFSLTWPNS